MAPVRLSALLLHLWVLTLATSECSQLLTGQLNASLALDQFQSTGDTCTELYNRLKLYKNTNPDLEAVVARPSDVRRCALTVPFNRNRELGNLRSVILYFENFYGIIQFAKSSPAPANLPSNYNIVQALRTLARRRWTRAEPFYSAIEEAVDRLNDGHTQLNPVCPPFSYALALPIVAMIEGGRQVIRVAPKAMLDRFLSTEVATRKPFNFDVSKFYRAQVMTINGKNSVKYMRQWANKHAGSFHDPAQQFNNAFAAPTRTTSGRETYTPGVFAFRQLSPVYNYMTFGLIRQGTTRVQQVRVPWMAITSALNLVGFVNKATYFAAFCKASASRGSSAEAFRWENTRHPPSLISTNLPSIHQIDGGDAQRGSSSGETGPSMRMIPRVPEWFTTTGVNESEEANAGQQQTPTQASMARAELVSGPDFFYPVYLLKDKKTGVVALHTFGIEESPDGGNPLDFLLNQASKAFSLANRISTRVIIDVTRNPGGFTALGWWVISLLMGTNKYPNPRSAMQDYHHFLVQTTLIRQLRDNNVGFYAWRGMANANEVPYTRATSSQFMFPTSVLKFGAKGVPGRYSRTFKIALPSLRAIAGKTVPPAFGKKPFLLFSDGTCFSTCNNFAFFLRRLFKIKLVTIGGLPNRRMAFAGGGGGFIMPDAEAFLDQIPAALRRSSFCPKPFTIRMALGMKMAWGGLYRGSSAIEFNYLPGDNRLSYTTANIVDRSLQYEAVSKFF